MMGYWYSANHDGLFCCRSSSRGRFPALPGAFRRVRTRVPFPLPRENDSKPMHTTKRLVHAASLTTLAAGLLAATAQAQKLDLNANGMSDVWENIFNSAALNPAGDADGDGVSNLAESLAGTDPFDSNSVPRMALSSMTATNFTLSMPCALGKYYEWQSIQGLGTNWVTESASVARSGTVVTHTAPFSQVPKFFRLVISDVDTDGDGLSDWEEYKLGLNPLIATSNGEIDNL